MLSHTLYRVKHNHFSPTRGSFSFQEPASPIQTHKQTVSVSAQDGIVELGKAHTLSAPYLSSLPKIALETVPMFVRLNTDRSRPQRVECWPLPFSTPLSFRRSVLWCSGLSMFRKFLKPLSTSALPSCRLGVTNGEGSVNDIMLVWANEAGENNAIILI